jgi:hypothetical protein
MQKDTAVTRTCISSMIQGIMAHMERGRDEKAF